MPPRNTENVWSSPTYQARGAHRVKGTACAKKRYIEKLMTDHVQSIFSWDLSKVRTIPTNFKFFVPRALVASSLPCFFFQIIDLLEDLLNHHSATPSSRSSALTALAKFSYRVGGGLGEEGKGRVEGMLQGYQSSIALELQQRWG